MEASIEAITVKTAESFTIFVQLLFAFSVEQRMRIAHCHGEIEAFILKHIFATEKACYEVHKVFVACRSFFVTDLKIFSSIFSRVLMTFIFNTCRSIEESRLCVWPFPMLIRCQYESRFYL